MAQSVTIGPFNGYMIDKAIPSGLYSAYVGDRFLKADTYCGMLDTLGGDREQDHEAYSLCYCDDCADLYGEDDED